MKISILCTSEDHPIFPQLMEWSSSISQSHEVELVLSKHNLSGGDILFLVSCNEIITKKIRDTYMHSLVLHASDLPNGRGWSPHIWQILEGKSEICVSLIEAGDVVDTGAIWKQKKIILAGHELYDEINAHIFSAELSLMAYAVLNYKNIKPVAQRNIKGSFYKKRNPSDSLIDPERSISEQFNLLRVSDPERYPAYFELNGYKYKIRLEKM